MRPAIRCVARPPSAEHPVCRWFARTAAGVSLLAGLASGIPARGQNEAEGISIEGRPPNAVILVGAANNMYPYSYEEDGRLQGFAVDIFDAVARETGIKASRLPINNRDAGQMLVAGRIDMILFWSETPERQKEMMMSTPLLTLQTVVVVRTDERRIRTLADLDGRILATGSPGTVASTYVRDHVKGATEVYSTHPEEILVQVSSGLADAGVLSRLTAATRIERLGLRNLRILEESVEGYDVRYGFMVRRGDARLLARLNEGITLAHRDGTYARIYSTWFGRHEPRRFSHVQVIAAVATAVALSLLALIVARISRRRLLRRLADQDGELAAERALRGLVFDTHPSAALVLESDGPEKPVRLVSCNRAAARLFRLDPEIATGRALADLVLPSEVAEFLAEVTRRWPAEGGTATLEHRLMDSRRKLTSTLHPLATKPEGGRRLGVLSTEAPHHAAAG
jgi:ABC-type amino acid transport substrate-binding protein